MIQTDACNTGDAAVYTTAVGHEDLRRECIRPRNEPSKGEADYDHWCVERAYSPLFLPSTLQSDWYIAFKGTYGAYQQKAHINEKELGAAVNAIRWACRAPRTRCCRIVLQSDSAVTVGVLRKGRSSRSGLLKHCRRLAAMALVEQIAVESRWVPTNCNMADQPSRGHARPGPCEGG